MQFTFEGTLKVVSKGREFTDASTGRVTPAKFTNYFATQNDEGEPQVYELRSKSDYSRLVDKPVVGTVELYPMREGSGFWASLVSLEAAEIE